MKSAAPALLIGATFCLVSCTYEVPDITEYQSSFCDKELSYCIDLPDAFAGSNWRPTIGPGGETASHVASTRVPSGSLNDVSVYVYHSSPSPHCGNIGVAEPRTARLGEQTAIRGKVDFPPDYELTQLQPDCRAYKPYAASYIFCSDKDDVQVAVCISQVTDDPALANSIFDTFRWTQ